MQILKFSQVTKNFSSGESTITVLNDISFELNSGELCAVVGPSGSGKSTLLALAAGLDTPSQGSIEILGRQLHSLTEDERATLRNREIGFVFQNFQLIPSLTALENVTLPAELYGARSLKEINAEGLKLLSDVGLAARTHHYPAQLSGGEQQRVAIARSLINSPQMLFADEPTGNLDGSNGAHVLDILFALNQERKTAILCVTHDLSLASRMARTITLQNGSIV